MWRRCSCLVLLQKHVSSFGLSCRGTLGGVAHVHVTCIHASKFEPMTHTHTGGNKSLRRGSVIVWHWKCSLCSKWKVGCTGIGGFKWEIYVGNTVIFLNINIGKRQRIWRDNPWNPYSRCSLVEITTSTIFLHCWSGTKYVVKNMLTRYISTGHFLDHVQRCSVVLLFEGAWFSASFCCSHWNVTLCFRFQWDMRS